MIRLRRPANFRHLVRSFFRFFDRPFTPRGWLRSARNFAKTRFRRFPTFDFSTPQIFFWWNFRSKKWGSNQKSFFLEKLWIFEHYWQILLEKWPHFPRRSSLSIPWWRGSKTIFDFFVEFWTKTDLQFFFEDDDMVIWWYDCMMVWWYDHMETWYGGMMAWWYDIMIWWCDDMMVW